MRPNSNFPLWASALCLMVTACGSANAPSAQKGAETADATAIRPAAQSSAPMSRPAIGRKGSGSGRNPCAAVGEGRFASARPDQCGGVWNIYASLSDGYVWYDDKMGEDPAARRIDANASRVRAQLQACGIRAELSLSDWFDSFAPGLVVVHSHPYATAALARAELQRAKACGLTGYSKPSLLKIVGRD
ncbi:MAG: hypothetical protein ACKOXK_06450 [Chakrabartia sp.]